MGYLDRYLAGEHEQVWAELGALGAAVRDEPLYSDALAVARETMRRALHNIETLIPRLKAVGYRFGYYWLRKDQREPDSEKLPLFAPADPDAPAQLADLENAVGPIPLSIVAWYETIGVVNFVGLAPRSWGLRDPKARLRWATWIATADDPDMPRDAELFHNAGLIDWERPEVVLDPLQVMPLNRQLAMLRDWQEEMRLYGDNPPFTLLMALSATLKYDDPNGWELYQVVLPQSSADTHLSGEWHDTTFVNYLRICFRWGGLPGLQLSPHPPLRDLAHLTEGLLPL